jgi:hypothetical protein
MAHLTCHLPLTPPPSPCCAPPPLPPGGGSILRKIKRALAPGLETSHM